MLLDRLKEIVGPGGWADDEETLQPHLSEWRDSYSGRTPLMVSPSSTTQVSEIVKACAAAGTAIVPQGGNTGLCGGAVPDSSNTQVLLSLAKMNRIRSVSRNDFTMEVEAGCILATIQAAAEEVDRFLPLSLAAEGSCQIGGNLSTNAGGINVLRYGTARDLVLGLEVVLADGDIWDGMRSLRKDTSGYDMKQLFIGAEGTLGVITAATLRLFPKPRNRQTAFLAVGSPSDAIDVLARMREELSDQLQAFELIPDRAIRFVCQHIPNSRRPIEKAYPWYVLLEASGGSGSDDLQDSLMSLHEDGLTQDVIIAKNEAEAMALWRLRHAISEAQKLEGASLKHDVSVPVNAIDRFIAAAEDAVSAAIPDVRVVAFGHVGDGNVHFNISQPVGWRSADFVAERDRIARIVYDAVASFGGSISAEHGIGQLKKDILCDYRSSIELGLMRTLKKALDPNGILNPGKVV